MFSINFSRLSDDFLNTLLSYAIQFIGAVLILVIGWYVARLLKKFTLKLLPTKRVDKTVATFVSEIVYYAVLAIVLIAFLSKIGIQTTSLAAILGASTLAIGYSLKDSISQLTAGMILVGTHPFRYGDTVEVCGIQGVVNKVTLLYTIVTTSDNQEVTLPNNQVLNSKIINFTKNKTRRINLSIGISYNDDIDHAKALLLTIAESDKQVLTDPKPMAFVQGLADSSVNLLLRAWVKQDDYSQTVFALTEAAKKIFDANQISMPYPQREIRIISD